MEITTSKVDDVCRLCLHGDENVSVFDIDCNLSSITPEIIYDCVSVKIGKDDKLPTVVCQNCIKHVENWCSFKSTCDKTQTTLMKWLLCNSLDDSPTEKELIEVSSTKSNDCEDNYVNAATNSDIVGVENQNGATNGVFGDSKSSAIPLESVPMKLNLKDLVLENSQESSNHKTVVFLNVNEDGNNLPGASMETDESESTSAKNVESFEKEKSVPKLTETAEIESPSVSNIVIASTTTLPIEEFNDDEQSEAKEEVTRAKDRSISDLAAMFKPTEGGEDPEEDMEEEEEEEDGATGEDNHSSSETANDPRIPVRYIKQEPVEFDETLEDDIPASLNLVPVKSEHYRMHHEEFLTPDDSLTRAADEEEDELMMLAEEEACDGYEPASGETENLQCLLCDLSFTSLGSLYQHMSTSIHEQKAMAAAAASTSARMHGGNASRGGRNQFLNPGSARHLYTDPGFPRDPRHYDQSTEGPTGFRGFSVADSYSKFNLLPPPDESFRCKICAVTFKKRFDYHRHTLTKKHRRNKKIASFTNNPNINRSPFICPMEDCNFSSIEGMKLLHHMKLHGISKPNQIPTSVYNRNERFLSGGSGQDMRQRKLDERNVFGGVGWQNQEPRVMLREREHAQTFPSPVQSPSISGSPLPMLNCRFCDQVFRNQGDLTRHYPICSERRASRHLDPEPKMICKRCNLSFTSKNVYMNHMQIYHKEDGFQIMPRPRKNAVPSNRIKKGHFYVCNQCGKKFTLLSSWSFHMKQHAQQKTTVGKFSCKICYKVFKARSTYRDHFRSHFVAPGSKELFCHKCFKVLPNRSELNLHKASGNCPSMPKKILSCDICQHTYTDVKALNKHKLTHQMQKVTSTPIADASYNRSNLNLISPQFSSTPKVQAFSNEFPRCDFCDRHYSNLGNLVKHMKTMHPEENLDGIRSKYATSVKAVKRPTQWICKHCNAVRSNRRYLVPHLRSCKFNIFRHKEGVCIQCGKEFISAKYKICPECLPEGALGTNKQPGELAMLLQEEPLIPNSQVLKQKPIPSLKPIPQVQKPILPPKPTLPVLSQKLPETIKEKSISKKELPKINIPLYKCPNGNRYFLKQVYIAKHLRVCTGNCYPMCGNCRREFGNFIDYREHLLTSKKCYRRKSINIKSVQFVTPEDESYADGEGSVNESSVAPTEGSVTGEITLGARTCTFCFKNLHMQRNIYRHLYTCVKGLYVAKENITCGRCGRVFGRVSTMKELAAQVKGHILDCYFVPYYEGEDVLPNGSPAPSKPPLVCYVCAFGFTSEVNLQKHIKDHRYKKDEVNVVVYRLEDLYKPSDESFHANWVHRAQVHNSSLPIFPASSDSTGSTVRQTKKKCINIIRDYVTQDSLDRKEEAKAFFKCDLCDRKFTTRGKLKNHKEAHENYLMTHGDHVMKDAGSSSFLSLTY